MDSLLNNENLLQSKATFTILRRLHGHNLESQGLNNLSEAFQSFVTRVKFFSVGRLRRTWSHSALEFMKYRRLLPMIVGDEQDPGSVFDEFMDIGIDGVPYTSRQAEAGVEERSVCVSNVSAKVTKNQLQSFFSKFGKVQTCRIPTMSRNLYATMPRRKFHGTCMVTFKTPQSAVKAKRAMPEELLFYGQQMVVLPYVSSSSSWRRTISSPNTKSLDTEKQQQQEQPEFSTDKLSRTSSGSSLASTGTFNSTSALAATSSQTAIPLDELPERVLTLLLYFVGPLARIRLERVNKRWLESATKAWAQSRSLHFCEEPELRRHFNTGHPLCHAHLRALLRRCGPHVRSLSLADINNQLLDENSLFEIGTLCPNLVDLDLSGISASPEALRALSEMLPKLTRIAYRGMTQTNERAFMFLLKPIASQICSLDLRGCTRLRGDFISLFGNALEEVLLDGCIILEEHVIEDLCMRCNCIHTLKLDGCRKLTDENLSLISRQLNELNSLSLCGEFPLFTAIGLTQITRIASLHSLSMDFNPLVNDNFLTLLAEGLKELRRLTIAFAGSDKEITAHGLSELVKLKQLEELDLSGLGALNNQLLSEICVNCEELRRVFVRNCCYLGDEGILALGKLEKLEHADLSGCILFSNAAVLGLCEHFKEEKNPSLRPVTLIVGGTICEPHKIRLPRNTRIVLDQTDNSSLNFNYFSSAMSENEQQFFDDQEDDDEFRILSAHRDFISNALQTEEDYFPKDDPEKIMEWAEREAIDLGLLNNSNQK